MAVVDYIRPRRSRLSRLAHRPAERPLTDDDLYRLTGRRRPSVVLAELLPDDARPTEQDCMAFANRFDCDAE
jgi:hypothetical protein